MGIFDDLFKDKEYNSGILSHPLGGISELIIDAIKDGFNQDDNKSNSHGSKQSAEYGDVIGIRRTAYKHFGIYINDNSVIHYASQNGDFGNDICIHKTTLPKFLNGSDSYFVCEFPKTYGSPQEIDFKTFSSSLFGSPIYDLKKLYDFLHKSRDYHLYSPDETVHRAFWRSQEQCRT